MKTRIFLNAVLVLLVVAMLAPITSAPAPAADAATLLPADCQLAADYNWSNYSLNQICIFVMQANDAWQDGIPDWLI